MGKVIGIDLGTTNSVAAFVEGGRPSVILTQEGEQLLPSMVAFTQNGDRLVGAPAKSQLLTNPNTIYSVKRLIGKRFSEVKPYLSQFHYKIVEGEDDTLKIRINDVLFSPEEISAMIIEKLKEAAEEYLNDVIEGAIITVPAYFNDSQRQATKDAGEIAGINVLRIINEPTAASLSFSIDLTKKSKVLVYDFGGGTIDISILDIQDEVIKVLSTAGDINLGGNDLDILLLDKILMEIRNEHQIDLTDDKMALQRIRDAAENAKKELSGVDECEINLPFLSDSDDGPIHYSRYFKRAEFEALIKEKVDRTFEICSRAMKSAAVAINEIDEIILVGGSTRIPMVQRKAKEFFKKEPNKKVNPDEIVAMGAALEGSIVKGESKDILLLDVTPLSLGVKTHGGAFTHIIDANTTIPTNRSLVFSTVEDNQDEVEIQIYQGERAIAEENKFLGKFTLTGIKPASKGTPRIEVSFSININGILKVTAMDLSTKSKKEVLVTHSGLLNDKEIAEIKKNAERYKEADTRKKQLIDIKNKIFNHIYAIQKSIENPKMNQTLVSNSKALIKKAKAAIEKEDPKEMETLKLELAAMEKHLDSYEIGSEAFTAPEKPFESEEEPFVIQEEVTRKKRFVSQEEKFASYKTPEPLASDEELISQEALKIKKEILNFVYAIEQYMRNVKIEGDLFSEAQELILKAHREVDNDHPRDLGKIHKNLSKMASRLDELVGRTLGIETTPTPKETKVPDFAMDMDIDFGEPPAKAKDDTKPFKIFPG